MTGIKRRVARPLQASDSVLPGAEPAAADALQQQAASLADAVSIFKLHAVPGVAAPARTLSLT